MDASSIAPPSLDWSRPWATRDDDAGNAFDQQTLVNIVTMGDEVVCEKCEEAATLSPYTLMDARQQLPIHPNCRCVLQTWSSFRRLPVQFGQPGAAPPQMMTMKQLGRAVTKELTGKISMAATTEASATKSEAEYEYQTQKI